MSRRWWIVGFLIVATVTLLSPLASSSPDGLERVAGDKEFLDKARDTIYRVIPDYVLPGVQNEALATILAGIIGTLVVFAVVMGLSYSLLRVARRRERQG